MTVKEAKSLCFEDRSLNYTDFTDMCESDLKFKVGDTVYLRPLKDIIKNRRVTSLAVSDENVHLYIDDGDNCDIPISAWGVSKVVTGIEKYLIDHLNVSIMTFYYTLGEFWVDEYMLTSKPPKCKQQQLLKHMKGITNGIM